MPVPQAIIVLLHTWRSVDNITTVWVLVKVGIIEMAIHRMSQGML